MKLAISGTPGTGKTSVANALSKRLGWRIVRLNDLAKEKNLYEGWDPLRHVPIIDVKKIRKEVEKMKGDMILESHYSHEIPADFVVILRTSPGKLRKRLVKKGWRYEKIEENVEAEIMEICRTEAEELGIEFTEIDTTEKKPEEVADAIIRKLGPRQTS